eukprot:1550865-Rhodomonas_salina.13
MPSTGTDLRYGATEHPVLGCCTDWRVLTYGTVLQNTRYWPTVRCCKTPTPVLTCGMCYGMGGAERGRSR